MYVNFMPRGLRACIFGDILPFASGTLVHGVLTELAAMFHERRPPHNAVFCKHELIDKININLCYGDAV